MQQIKKVSLYHKYIYKRAHFLTKLTRHEIALRNVSRDVLSLFNGIRSKSGRAEINLHYLQLFSFADKSHSENSGERNCVSILMKKY